MIYFSFDRDRLYISEEVNNPWSPKKNLLAIVSIVHDNKTHNVKELIMDFPRAKSRLFYGQSDKISLKEFTIHTI